MARWCVALTLIAACGRVGFDARADAGDLLLGFNGDARLDGCVERLAFWPFALNADELAAAGVL